MALSGITDLKPTRQENIIRPEIDDIKTRVHRLEVQELPYVTLATVTTKGDLLVATGAAILARLAVGANNLALLADSATATGLKWGQVPTAGLADVSITTAKLVDLAVTTAKIADANVTTAKIADANVPNVKLANMADSTLKGRNVGAGAGAPIDLSAFDVVGIIKTSDGAGSGLDADMLDGLQASAFAILANAQSFTTTQTIAPSATNVDGLLINMPTSTANAAAILKYNNVTRFTLTASADNSSIDMAAFNNGSSIGPAILIRNNSNGSTPAAGSLGLFRKGGAFDSVWVDNSGNLRIWTSNQPTSATDTSGTVIGTQTSSLDTKDIIDEFIDNGAALRAILTTPLYRFRYKNNRYDQEFVGIVTDYAPLFGMDRDKEHPAGKSLNVMTAHGLEMAAIKALAEQVTTLAEQVVALTARLNALGEEIQIWQH